MEKHEKTLNKTWIKNSQDIGSVALTKLFWFDYIYGARISNKHMQNTKKVFWVKYI